MECTACGTENRADRRFCRSCGAALGATCPVCGASNEPGDRFCGTCGASLESGAPVGQPATATRVGTPGAAAPGITAPPPTATERRFVSVLFADLVGSTAMAEGQDVEAVREVLGRYYETAREIVDRYGGVIEKFIGDAVMAVWGSPVAHEDDAERAVRAALDLVEAASRLRSAAGAPLATRAAVLTGEAAVALDAEGQGMVAGDLVNTASRLQSVAAPGHVLVGEATVRSSEAAIAYEPAGEQELKGRSAPVAAWRAARVVAGRRGSKRATRLEAPFVGRDDELRLLKEVFHQTARERRPRLVSITGIAGIGKSRLAWELEKYIDGLVETVYWHQGRSPAYGEGLAFWALGEMVRGRARIAETDEPAIAREKLAAMAADLLPDEDERARVEPRLAALLGLEAAPPGGAEELTAAWRTLFERVADRGPTVLVFEDLHWAESGLLEFIEGLLVSARSRPLLVVALARPELIERRPTWGATVRNHLRLDLAPLDDEAMDLLLLGLAPGIPQDALRTIRRRAEGVPLYAVETVRMLLDQGRLTETDGRFRLVGDLGELAVPDSLQALLGARLDALEPPLRDLASHAAVLGISFTSASVAVLASRPETDVRAGLDELVDRELLVFDDDPRSAERGQYRFLQGVLREVAYGRLSRRERVARHLAAAEHFSETGSTELAGVVASHYLEAVRTAPDGDERDALIARALAALEAAATRAHAIGAYASAARHLDDALELAADEATRLRIREARLRERYEANDIEGVEPEARSLIEVGRARGDPGLQARAAFALAGALLGRGRPADAVSEVAAVRDELGADATETVDGVRLSAELARCLLMSGDPDGASEVIERILPIAQRIGDREAVAELLPSKGWALAAQGRPLEAIALHRGSLVFAEREGWFRAEVRSRMNLSAVGGWEDPAESFEVTSTGLRRARERGYDGWTLSLFGNAASLAMLLGEWDWIERTVDESGLEERDAPWEQSPKLVMALIRAYRGDAAGARDLYERAAAITSPLPDPQLGADRHSTLGEVSFAGGDLAAARAVFERADELRRTQGLPVDPIRFLIVIEERDEAEVRRLLGDPPAGRLHALVLEAWAGAARALAGDLPGLAEMDAAADQMLAEGVRFSAAQMLRARAMIAPDDPGARAAAERAAEVFRELGAITMLRGLEGLIDGRPASVVAGATPGERTRTEEPSVEA